MSVPFRLVVGNSGIGIQPWKLSWLGSSRQNIGGGNRQDAIAKSRPDELSVSGSYCLILERFQFFDAIKH